MVNLPEESELKETFYHRLDPPQGFALQRVYTDDRALDVTMAVEDGDVVLVPKGYHPCGTARMGQDPKEAAVDHRLRAHGLEGLRIVDASIFPTVTSGNINAPSIMVGEKGADLILADAR